MRTLLEDALNTEVHDLTTVGLHHEMQHQELMLTDVLHLLSFNPLNPKLIEASEKAKAKNEVPLRFIHREGGIVSVGAEALGFSYDCERPVHKNYLTPFSLSNRLVNNGDWLEFINNGGYQNSLLWLSDGWALAQQNNWSAPLYWKKIEGEWFQYGLDGMQAINKTAPVCHVSYYEANAFANWAGARLPREHELEFVCVAENAQEGNFLEKGHWRPTPAKGLNDIEQLYGDVWEWTQSAYLPYPNFKAEQGALGEYNGKFMSNQMVLKGGSCVTPELQMRPSYRNFFYPHQRWQFMGFRLAKDL